MAGLPHHVLSPDQLHRSLAQPAVREDRGLALPQRPIDELLLELEKEIRHPQRIKSVEGSDL